MVADFFVGVCSGWWVQGLVVIYAFWVEVPGFEFLGVGVEFAGFGVECVDCYAFEVRCFFEGEDGPKVLH